MEIKFSKTGCPCLRQVVSQVQTQEQTQELRLPDVMPDIGRVLGCWGQVLIRSKEWRGNSMSVSGGVLAWVVYAPEDGSEPRSVDTWIPFQMRWDLPDTQRDGSICITPLLKGMDARSTSARKLMLRANVSLLGQAMEPVEPEIASPEDMGQDVELFRVSYPLELPREAGERLFQVEEEMILPGTYPQVRSLLRYECQPEILEYKVMAGRLVFRGNCNVHILYSSDSGLQTWDAQVPFSQYAELDRDHSPNATSWIMPMVTGLEMMQDEQNRLQLKYGMAVQYVIYDRVMVETVADAYSPVRQIKTECEELELPMCLEIHREPMEVQVPLGEDVERILDLSYLPDHPSHRQNGDTREFDMPGMFQMLYYDKSGMLQNSTCRAEGHWQCPSDAGNRTECCVRMSERPQGTANELTARWELETAVFAQQGLPMVTCVNLGEEIKPDPGRPSLILRRTGSDSLWDIAKACGSTVDAIRKANGIQEEPEPGRLLLIPVS